MNKKQWLLDQNNCKSVYENGQKKVTCTRNVVLEINVVPNSILLEVVVYLHRGFQCVKCNIYSLSLRG